jgi:hypothetical protein
MLQCVARPTNRKNEDQVDFSPLWKALQQWRVDKCCLLLRTLKNSECAASARRCRQCKALCRRRHSRAPRFARKLLFAHALDPKVELSCQKESDLLWITGEFLSSNDDFGKLIVHGRTPTREIEVGPNRINIDTGAFATGRPTCLAIEGESLSVIDTSCAT